MANPATEFTIQAKVVGADQVEGLKSAVQSLRNRAIPAAEDINKLRDAAKSLGNAAEASTSDLRTSVTVLKSLKDQVALTSKEYRDLSNDLKTVENRFNAANTAAKQFSASAGPLSGGTAGAGIMGRPTEKLDPYMRLGFETNDPEYWRKRQETHPGGAAIFPQQLDYAATNKALSSMQSANDQMTAVANKGRQDRLLVQEKYNQLEIEQQDAAHKKSLQIEKRNDDLDLEDFDRRLNQRVAIREKAEQAKAKRRQRLAAATQSVGAVAAAGVFGGPEGAIGAALGAFGGPQGALIGGAIGAQVGMLRQSAAGVAEYATQLTLAKITLAQASTGIQQYNQQLQIARNVSKDYSVGLLETINGYAQVAIAAKANGLSVAQTENIYRGVIATGVAFGKSQEDISAIVRATTQILSKAKVTAEELGGQLGERIPGAVAKFAEKTGRSLPGLAKDLEQGKVTIADFVAFTKGQLDDYDKIARIIGESPEKAGARLKIALDTAAEDYGGFFQTIGAQFQDFATRLISWVNENSEAIKRFVTFTANNFINLIAGIDLLIGKIEEIPKAFEKYLLK
jgi:tape measure domain-containing protein